VQRTSRPPELHTSCLRICGTPPALRSCVPPRRNIYIQPPDLQTCMSTLPQRSSRAPELHTFKPPCRHGCSVSSCLYNCMSLQLKLVSRPPTSMPTRRQRASGTRYLHASMQRTSQAPELHTSTPTRLRHNSGSSELRTSTSQYLHPASRPPDLQTSIPAYLHSCSVSPEL